MLEAINRRRSVRQYLDKEIPEQDMEYMIEAAMMAPSPFNLQPWRFYVVRDEQKKIEIRKIYDSATKNIKLFKKLHLTRALIYDQNTSFLETATLIVPCYEKKVSYARDCLAMAVENLMIQAASRGIGTVCMGRPTAFNKHRKQIKKLFEISAVFEVPYIIAAGYPSKTLEEFAKPSRKDPGDVVINM